MNDNLDKAFNDRPDLKSFLKDRAKTMRGIFSDRIKGNFLIDMEWKVINMLGADIITYYDLKFSKDKIVSLDFDMFDYDICRHIVGLHRSNMILNMEEERLKKESSEEYKDSLAKDVIDNIKLRQLGNALFRKKSLMKGDNFIFFHVPYNLFVLCVRINELLKRYGDKLLDTFVSFYTLISEKGVAALTLLEDNFLNDTYPLCRGIIELYVKFLVLKACPNVIEKYNKFTEYDWLKSFSGQDYTDEFNELYQNRKNKSCTNKVDYLHFGWLDFADDYHVGEKRAYSISGIISYLKFLIKSANSGDDLKVLHPLKVLSSLETLYKYCHSFTHGSTLTFKYPIRQYFDISQMLYFTIIHTYIDLCKYLNVDTKIKGIDVVGKLIRDFNRLQTAQHNCKNEECLAAYYRCEFNKFLKS